MTPVEILGWSLIHFLWQGAAVYLLLSLTLFAGRSFSAGHRYGICCFGLFLMFFCPLLTAAVLRGTTTSPSLHAPPAAETTFLVPLDGTPPDGLGPETRPYLGFIVAFWLCGSCCCSLRLITALVGVTRMRRRCAPIIDAALWSSLQRFAWRLKIRCPRLVASSHSVGPTAFGVIRATIAIPVSLLSSLPPDQLDALIAHELAHIRRHDYLVNILQSLIEALLFYHPAVWWVSNRIRAERELACDDLALSMLTDRRSYARALATLESNRAAQVAVAASGGDLLFRIKRVLGEPAMKNRSTTSVAGGIAALILVCGSLLVMKAKAQDAVPAKADDVAVQQQREAAEQQRAESESDLRAAEAQVQASRAALRKAEKDLQLAVKSRRSAIVQKDRARAEKRLRRQSIERQSISVDAEPTIAPQRIRAEIDRQNGADIAIDAIPEPEIATTVTRQLQDADRAELAIRAERTAIAKSKADLSRQQAVVSQLRSRAVIKAQQLESIPVLSDIPVIGRLYQKSIPAPEAQDAPVAIAPQQGRATPALPATPAPLTRAAPQIEPVTPAARTRRSLTVPQQPAEPAAAPAPRTPRSITISPRPSVPAAPKVFLRSSRARTIAPAMPAANGRILEDELDRLEIERINLQAGMRRRNRDSDESRGVQDRLDNVKWKINEVEKALARKRSRLQPHSSSAVETLAGLRSRRSELLTKYTENHPVVQDVDNKIEELGTLHDPDRR